MNGVVRTKHPKCDSLTNKLIQINTNNYRSIQIHSKLYYIYFCYICQNYMTSSNPELYKFDKLLLFPKM